MNVRDFRIGWRLLIKEPAYSGAVIAGLAIGLAVCVLLLGFVRYSFTYNAHVHDNEWIFVVKERRNALPRPEWRARAPSALHGIALSSGPGIDATRATLVEVAARSGASMTTLALRVVDPNYLDFFGKRALDGDAGAALARPDALVLSRSKAQQLFGRVDALGRVLHIDGVPFEVKAILEDEPGNTTVGFDALVGRGKHSWDAPPSTGPIEREWTAAPELYVKLPAGAGEGAAAALTAVMQDAVTGQRDARLPAAWRERLGGARLTDISLARLADVYFDESLLRSRAGAQYGNRALVIALGGLALLILALASTNYINLAAVRTVARQREIGVRKVLGAGPAQLASQFIAESLLVCLLATLAGLGLAWLAAPLFGELVHRPMGGMLDATLCAGALALGALTGVLSALYPAWIALRLPARDTTRGRAGSESASALQLRRLVTVFQCGTAIALIGVTLAVGWQADYASDFHPGFDAAPVLVLSLPDDTKEPIANAFRAELEHLPQVEGVAAISEAVGRDGFKLTQVVRLTSGGSMGIEIKPVSANFFALLGVRAQVGRVFDKQRDLPGTTNIILNAMGARAFGFDRPEDALGRIVDGDKQIVGIAPDLRYRTLREKPEPMMYLMNPAQPVLLIRTAGNRTAVTANIAGLWQRHFPEALFDIVPAATVFANNYNEDRRLGKILTAASVVATVLAAFGIYVLSAYSVKRRAREIVLRKIHGATQGDIGRLVVREFVVLLSVGALIGVPLALLAIERYLSGFVERAPMGAWPAMVALACVAVVAMAAIVRHTLVAMRMFPATALRA